MNQVRTIIYVVSLLISTYSYGARLVVGDATNGNQSFTFPIQQHVLDVKGNFYVGADQAIPDNTFALSMANQRSNFGAFAPAQVTLDGVATSSNPINGAKIDFLNILYPYVFPVVVIDSALSSVYLLNTANGQMFSAQNINDATEAETAGIVGLSSGSAGFNGIYNYIFAAVKKNGGNFGDVGGGVALIKYLPDGTLGILNANNNTSEGNVAAALDGTSTAVTINANVTIAPNIVDMTFDPILQRLYVVLEVTAGAGATDGARALVMGSIVNDVLTFLPIAPNSVFSGNNQIAGGVGSGAQISLYKVRTIETSSRLNYAIVAGSNGAPSATGNTIFALPLVNLNPVEGTQAILDPNHGTLANVNSTPVDKYFTTPANLQSRGFVTPAISPADVFTTSSVAAIVGGGPLPLAPSQQITDIVALNDAVYVSIGNSFSTTTQPGVFCTQAILDSLGRIINWTPWQRASGTQQQIFGIAVDTTTDTVWMLPGSTVDTVDTVSLTQWSTGAQDGLLGGTTTDASVGLVSQISQELPQSPLGGVHNLFVFTPSTPSFGQNPSVVNNQLSLMIATGFGKIVLAETGSNASANIFTPNSGDFATGKQEFTNGTLEGFVSSANTKLIAISGGILSSLGPIMAAEVSRTPLSGSTTNGYLFVGGAFGLAVLADTGLIGWDTSSPNGGLHAGFGSLTSTMTFTLLGSYAQVRKLWSDSTYLYVLTNTTFDRITLSSIASGPLQIVNLATPTALGLPGFASLSDFGVSNKFGVLGTSAGLFRVGNGQDITSGAIQNPSDLDWTLVNVPEGLGPVTRFLFISPTGDEGGFAFNGMIYALSAAVAYNQSQINRFFISDVRSGPISNTTMQPLNDIFIQGTLSYLISFGSYRNYIATDGIMLFNSRSGNQNHGPLLQGYAPYKAGAKYVAAFYNFPILQFPPTAQSDIRHLLRNISGSWLVSGDFGLQVNE